MFLRGPPVLKTPLSKTRWNHTVSHGQGEVPPWPAVFQSSQG